MCYGSLPPGINGILKFKGATPFGFFDSAYVAQNSKLIGMSSASPNTVFVNKTLTISLLQRKILVSLTISSCMQKPTLTVFIILNK